MACVILAIITSLNEGWHIENPHTLQLHVIVDKGREVIQRHDSYDYKVQCIVAGSFLANYFFVAGVLGFYGSLKSRFRLVVAVSLILFHIYVALFFEATVLYSAV